MAKSRLATFMKGEKKTFGEINKSVAAVTKKVLTKTNLKESQLLDDDLSKIEIIPEYLEVKKLIKD
jgi:hypothetical protein